MRIDPDNVRWLREERGLSVKKLAKMSGVPETTIVAIEAGEYRGSPNCASKLASGLSGAGHGEPVTVEALWLPEQEPRR